MTRTVWKYHLSLGATEIRVPWGSEVVAVGHQNGELYVWIERTSEEHRDEPMGGLHWIFNVVGTGHAIPYGQHSNTDHVGTVFLAPFVWHIYWSR